MKPVLFFLAVLTAVVLPNPDGEQTQMRRRPSPLSRMAATRPRATSVAGARGGSSLVASNVVALRLRGEVVFMNCACECAPVDAGRSVRPHSDPWMVII